MESVELRRVATRSFGSESGWRGICPVCRLIGVSFRNERLEIKQELQIRSKALIQKDFPSTQIIHEFKKKLDPPKEFESSWGQPNIVKFVVSYFS